MFFACLRGQRRLFREHTNAAPQPEQSEALHAVRAARSRILESRGQDPLGARMPCGKTEYGRQFVVFDNDQAFPQFEVESDEGTFSLLD